MIIYDTIRADTVEVGDQILIRGEAIEVTSVTDDEGEILVFWGISYDEGDAVEIRIPFDDFVDLWGI